MIPTNTLEELTKAEFDLQRSQVSLIREISKGNEKSRLHANTLQAMASALIVVQGLIEGHADNQPKTVFEPAKAVVSGASSAAVKVDPTSKATAAAPKKKAK